MRSSIAILTFLWSITAWAEDIVVWDQFYYGGGLATNSVEGGAGKTALQLFAGMPMVAECSPQRCLGVEVGYQDTSDIEADALWGAAVGTWQVAPYVELVGRLGVALGDYSSVLAGAGVGYAIEKHMTVRFEFVARNGVNSVQFNLAYYPARM